MFIFFLIEIEINHENKSFFFSTSTGTPKVLEPKKRYLLDSLRTDDI